jgi:hypothetical protein
MSTKREQILKAAIRVLEADTLWHERVAAFDKLLDDITSEPKQAPEPTKAKKGKKLKEPAPTPPIPVEEPVALALDPKTPRGKVMRQLRARPKHVFSPAEFKLKKNKLTMSQIYNALSDLTRQGYIERVAAGAYRMVS